MSNLPQGIDPRQEELFKLVQEFFNVFGVESLQQDMFFWLKCAISSQEIENCDTFERAQLMDVYWGVYKLLGDARKIIDK